MTSAIVSFHRFCSFARIGARCARHGSRLLFLFTGLAVVIWAPLYFSTAALAGTSLTESRLFGGHVEIQVDDYLELPAWDDVNRRLASQQVLIHDCQTGGSCRSEGAGMLAAVLERLATKDRRTQVNEINRLFNKRPYVEDSRQFNREDKWQLPIDLLEGGGDCEDFAIAKYFALRQLGVPEDDLRIIVAQEPTSGSGHAFLAVALDGTELILDYDSRPATQTVVPVRPRYAFNAHKRWLFVPDRNSR